jgi:tRNA-2-methylthio-N6-dimethylallyladenosine synthase
LTRGRERSRPPEDILREVALLSDRGYREITLLGQTVNSYGMKLNPPATFATLLRRIDAEVGKAMRVRFTTSHPKDVTAELIEAMATLPCVCEHIHLPVQAGSTRTLRRMERGYTREEYIEKVSALRNAIPSLAISTDIIVGFPGESESDFADTLSLMRELAFDASFAFKFSPRPNTPAADYADQIPEAVRADRLAQVLALQDESSLQKNQELIGQTAEVLVDRELRKRDTGLAAGRTRQNRIVHFRGGEIEEGVLASVQITGATAHHLKGVLTASS